MQHSQWAMPALSSDLPSRPSPLSLSLLPEAHRTATAARNPMVSHSERHLVLPAGLNQPDLTQETIIIYMSSTSAVPLPEHHPILQGRQGRVAASGHSSLGFGERPRQRGLRGLLEEKQGKQDRKKRSLPLQA